MSVTLIECILSHSSHFLDQVKQYQKIHELRRAVAVKNSGTAYPGDYFFEFSCGRGGSGSGNTPFNEKEPGSIPQFAAENESDFNVAHGTEDILRP